MNLRNFITSAIFSISLVFSQFNYQVNGGYYDRAGNTDYKYYNAGFSVTSYGDINFGGITVKDSEFLLSVDKNFQHTLVRIMSMIKIFYFFLTFGQMADSLHLS